MKRSLNEVERICQKAAEGAGAPAGLDVDAAAGAAWLLAHGFDALDGLAEELERFPDLAPACRFEASGEEARYEALDATDKAGALVAPLLVDLLVARAAAGSPKCRSALKVRNLTAPLFLLHPAVAHARDGWQFRFALESADAHCACRVTPSGATLLGDECGGLGGRTAWTLDGRCARDVADLGSDDDAGLAVLAAVEELAATQARSLAEGVEVAGETWTRLQALALKVLVPASEQSRLKGAGAKASDNE